MDTRTSYAVPLVTAKPMKILETPEPIPGVDLTAMTIREARLDRDVVRCEDADEMCRLLGICPRDAGESASS